MLTTFPSLLTCLVRLAGRSNGSSSCASSWKIISCFRINQLRASNLVLLGQWGITASALTWLADPRLVLIQALHVHVRPTRARRRTAHHHLIQCHSWRCRKQLCWQHFWQEQVLSRSLSKCVAIISKLVFLVCIPVCIRRSKHALVKMP